MISAVFPPSIGGIQSHTLRLGQKLVERGVRVHVLTRIERDWAPHENMGGVEVHRLGWATAHPPALSGVAFIAAASRKVVELRGEVDILHAHQLLSPTLVGLFSAPLVNKPLILNPHACGDIGDVGLLSASLPGRLRLAAAVKRADAFVAVSRAIADELRSVGARASIIHAIPNGVDTTCFHPSSPSERAALRRELSLPAFGPLVAYTGRLAPEKGVDVLLSAWPAVIAANPAAKLVLVGSGGDDHVLRGHAVELGISGSVLFAGGVPDSSPYLRAADVGVLPSRTEGMPVALLEAMACALPVVATAVGGTKEVLADGVTGRLVPSEDPAALARGLVEALSGDALALGRGEAARAHVTERYALDAIADRFIALYRTLLAQRVDGALAQAPGSLTR